MNLSKAPIGIMFILIVGLFVAQLIYNWKIIFEVGTLTAVATACFIITAYLTIQSGENIARYEQDPVLWINPMAGEDDFYIMKNKKYPAYNISVDFLIKLPNKNFKKLINYNLGTLIKKEENYNINFEKELERLFKKLKIKKCNFSVKYILKYYTRVDNTPIIREEILYYNVEELEGELMFGASFEKDFDLDGGKKPTKINRYYQKW